MAKRRASSGGSGGGVALFGVLLIIGIVIKFFWWFVAAGVLVGLFFAGRRARYADAESAHSECAQIGLSALAIARTTTVIRWVVRPHRRGPNV